MNEWEGHYCMYLTPSVYSLHWHAARCRYVQAYGGSASRGERILYFLSKVELYRDGVQAVVHRLLAYGGVRVVVQKAMPEWIQKKKTRYV